ncbi:hypothetical protein GCM10022261_11150 [Brevibacterium daeguense]|uniref:Uncharacterized protein n=1 Tax=Brevibacterium daeguense TaxID=909936 RepID=A0ABP8EHY9_9MICO|nr:hypothetical protein [Brevibacterium daeguense]
MALVPNQYHQALEDAARELEKYHPWALGDVERILAKFDEGVWLGGESDQFRSESHGRKSELTAGVDERIDRVSERAGLEPHEVEETDPRANWGR